MLMPELFSELIVHPFGENFEPRTSGHPTPGRVIGSSLRQVTRPLKRTQISCISLEFRRMRRARLLMNGRPAARGQRGALIRQALASPHSVAVSRFRAAPLVDAFPAALPPGVVGRPPPECGHRRGSRSDSASRVEPMRRVHDRAEGRHADFLPVTFTVSNKPPVQNANRSPDCSADRLRRGRVENDLGFGTNPVRTPSVSCCFICFEEGPVNTDCSHAC